MASQPEVGVSDFVLLDNLTTDKFIENLHLRFQHNKIYTNIGEVLVSVNPYKTLDIYGAATMMQYRGREMFEVPPHVYAVADACQRVLRQQGRDTCVLISGESGSGKTEASKFIMKYIAANTTENQREYIDRIKNVLIQSNAILETFGNAKTNRNDNSSRFGKYMDIHFSAGGDPAGGHVSNYLLEKSRVVAQQPGERNFHAFYQLLSSSKASKLGLSSSTQYQFLGPGRPTSQDGQLFAATNSAFNALGFPPRVVDEIWSIVAAVVLLGELTFSETPDGNLHIGGPLSQCVSSLGISSSSLQACMAGRVLCAGGELVSKQHSLHDAAATRHALAKAAYDRLFAWIVQQINKAIDVPSGTHASSVIGVLDIYGFEIFDTNSFEQFCINYCNEKLQQLFIELVLKQEQEEYSREGITWTPVAYFNNRVICELVDAPHQGIIAIMDEACLNPTKISDRQLLEAMDKRLSGHKHYTSRQLAPTDKKLQHGVDFRITHYAGEVTYAITNFMDKNQDSLWQDLKRLLHSSTNASLKDMWPEGGTTIQKTSKRPPSAATLFRNSMQALVQGLLSKEPFYVRCVKPNPRQAPNSWDEQLVRHQVSYLGLVENVRVRRAGFASRQRYDRFLRRYKMLSQYTWPNYRGTSDKEAVLVLLRDLAVTDFQAGHTKLFIRSAKTVHQLETARAELIPSIVVLLQKLWRGALARQRYRKMKAALRIFHAWRRYRSRRYIAELQTELARNRGLIRHWPPPPRGARVACLPPAYRRWRAYLTLKPIPRDQWPQLKMKICAASALKGRRREWGARRQWLGDYLAQDSYNSKAVPNMEPVPGPSHGSVPVPDRDGGTPPRRRRRRRRVSSSSSSSSCSSSSSDTCSSAKRSKRSRRHRRKKSKHESRTDQRMDQLFKELATYRAALSSLQRTHNIVPLFSCRVHKFNKHNKLAARCVLVTDSLLYKLDDVTFKPLKKPTEITEIGAIRIMSSDAQLVVISVPRAKNDLVVGLVGQDDLVGELVGVLTNRYTALTNASLPVEVESGVSTRCTLGGRARALQLPASVEPAGGTPFTHQHNVITYHPHSATA
ncbi:unconventional myosin-Id isoform X2 [Plutella xylostella]|uniref:unconventional myosin-Id isoform X2 n=1 Tax=Plutella xylostella TaxID=51655 RepID=UPI002032CA8A|nr:unconventional myosin-Id isoform X2 [Plutella xylostella]